MPPKRIAILGAGISGLAFAYRLTELSKESGEPAEILLLEASSRAGGTIQSNRRDGFLLEGGPDSFLSEKPWAMNLSKRLGIESEVISTRPDFRRTFVAKGAKLHGLPEGFYLIAPRSIRAFLSTPLFSIPGKIRMLGEYFLPPDRTGADESVASFIRRRFGLEALERVGQAMIAGVYSGDPDRLSILSAMPRFRELEAKHGSVIRGLRKGKKRESKSTTVQGPRYSLFLTYQNGMETLVRALALKLEEASLRLNREVQSIDYDHEISQWRLHIKGDEVLFADALCLAVSAAQAAAFLKPIAPKLSAKLTEIPYESVATLNVGFRTTQVRHPLDGFGFVVPSIEQKSLIACTFSSRKFEGRAPDGCTLMRAFIGGAFGKDYFNREDPDLIEAVLKDLNNYLGIAGKPLFTELRRYPQSLPQYCVGHATHTRRIEREVSTLPYLVLTGSSYRGTGIPDCIHDAEQEAEKLWGALCRGGGIEIFKKSG